MLEPMVPFEDTTDARARADLGLVQRALAGEPDARKELARRLQCVPRMLSAINSRRGFAFTSHDLEDLTQDSLVKILEKLETFEGHTTLEFWAHRFCYLEAMNRLRARGRRVTASEPDVLQRQADTADSVDLDSEGPLLWLERMDAREAEVVRQKLLEGRSFDEIGSLLGLPPATAKSRYYRGIAWLQDRLGVRGRAPR